MRIIKRFLPLIPLLALLAGCATDNAVISQASQMNGQLDPAIMKDPELAGYLQQIGDRVINTAKELDKQGYGPSSHKSGDSNWMFSKNMKFHFVNSKTLNAFTTGGEHMYIYNALFQMCKDEDELAAVMSHEYGHVYARHVAKGMNRQYAALAAAAALGGAGYVAGGKERGSQYAAIGAGAGGVLGQFVNMGFTRKDEAEADKLGFDFYSRAGWDPNHFGEFFQDMIAAGYDKTPAITSDHPTLASRVQEANQRAKSLPPQAAEWRKPPVASPATFRQLQQRALALGKTTPDDKSIANAQQVLAALPRSCVIPYTTQDEVQARQAIADKAEKAQPAQASDGAPAKKRKKRPAPAAPEAATSPPPSRIIGRSN